MIPRKLPAAQALVWARQAINVGTRSPKAVFGAALLLVCTLYAALVLATTLVQAAGDLSETSEPSALLGWLAPVFLLLMVLLPVLLGGLMHVIREAEAGRAVRARDVYAPLRSGRLSPLAGLGGVQLVFGALGAVLVATLAGTEYWTDYFAAMRSALGGAVPVMPQPEHPLLLTLAQLLFNYVSYAVMLFSIPLILFSGASLAQAVVASLSAALRNALPYMFAAALFVGATVVFTLVLGIVSMVVIALANLAHAALAALVGLLLLLVFATVLLAVLASGALFAWRDTFGEPAAAGAIGRDVVGIEV